jgi:hypothetical protein
MVKKGRPFEPGNQCGRGRPRGSRNKKSRKAQQLLDRYGESVIGRALLAAKNGNVAMQRALLPYIVSRPKDAPVKTGPLPVHTAEELAQSSEALFAAVASGQITVQDALELSSLIEYRRGVMETREFDARLRALEERKRNDG